MISFMLTLDKFTFKDFMDLRARPSQNLEFEDTIDLDLDWKQLSKMSTTTPKGSCLPLKENSQQHKLHHHNLVAVPPARQTRSRKSQ